MLTMDLHNGQFSRQYSGTISMRLPLPGIYPENLQDVVVVSPDAGGVEGGRQASEYFWLSLINAGRHGHQGHDPHRQCSGKEAII
jgi:phosphoribosylpyrophosphate synthetase